MTTKSDTRTEGGTRKQIAERHCLICERVARVIGKVGPIEIKESCPNKCSAGYVPAIRKDQG